MVNELLLMFSVFGAVAALGWFATRMLRDDDDDRLRTRLNAGPGDPVDMAPMMRSQTVAAMLSRVGQVASNPFMPRDREKQSNLRQTLARAGIYSPATGRAIIGAKFICLCGGMVGGYVLGAAIGMSMLGISAGGLLGYLLPILWLRQRVRANQQALTFALPDALDLLVVCVEAGLTIDASLQRVGDELMLAHPALSREFGIAHMETRVGLSRIEALKNLAQRTGNTELQSMTAMLVQADRFGTSIAQALRVHAESLRIARQHAADEMVGKASVKLTFPLVLFILPATFIILAGPTVIGLMNSSLFTD